MPCRRCWKASLTAETTPSHPFTATKLPGLACVALGVGAALARWPLPGQRSWMRQVAGFSCSLSLMPHERFALWPPFVYLFMNFIVRSFSGVPHRRTITLAGRIHRVLAVCSHRTDTSLFARRGSAPASQISWGCRGGFLQPALAADVTSVKTRSYVALAFVALLRLNCIRGSC
jgi:hypothetical protein